MNRGAKSLSLSGAAYFSISPAVCMPRQKISLPFLCGCSFKLTVPKKTWAQACRMHQRTKPERFTFMENRSGFFLRRRHFPPAVCIHPGGGSTKNAKLFALPLAACLSRKTFFLLKLGLRVHKAGYGRSVSTALFLCRSVHRKFLNVIVIPLYGSSGRPAKLHALSGQQYKAVVRFSLPGRQTNLRPGAVDVKKMPSGTRTKPLIRHVSPASCTKALLQCRKGHRGTDLQHRFFAGVISGMSIPHPHPHPGTIRESPFRLRTVRTGVCADAGPRVGAGQDKRLLQRALRFGWPRSAFVQKHEAGDSKLAGHARAVKKTTSAARHLRRITLPR